MTHDTAVVLFSGGQDSTTCLFLALRDYARVYPLSINYGQRHLIELEAAKAVLNSARAYYPDTLGRQRVIDLPARTLLGKSPLVNSMYDVEEYDGPDALPGGVENTFVPMRNALFGVLAANLAVVVGAKTIIMGVSQEDFGGYPDCRATFLGSLNVMIMEALGARVGGEAPRVVAPLIDKSKKETVEMAVDLPGCWGALAYTHTCYHGEYPPNPRNHASILRARGFHEAGRPDPLIERAIAEGKLPATYPRDGLL